MLFERSADLIETVECSVIEAACFFTMRCSFQPRSIVPVFGSSPFFCQYASRTFSTTSGFRSAVNEVREFLRGNPRRTAIRMKATSSARQFAMVVGLQGWTRLPFAERRGLARPARSLSMSRRRPSGNSSQGGVAVLDRRLGERLQRPAFARSHAGIPGPHHGAPRRVTDGHSSEFGAIGPIVLEDCVVDGRWIDPGAEQ